MVVDGVFDFTSKKINYKPKKYLCKLHAVKCNVYYIPSTSTHKEAFNSLSATETVISSISSLLLTIFDFFNLSKI